jgi:FlaA1/EpsC-like NDP-sugar epimerase
VTAVRTDQCTEQAKVNKHTTFVGLIFFVQHVKMYRAVCRYCCNNACLKLVSASLKSCQLNAHCVSVMRVWNSECLSM